MKNLARYPSKVMLVGEYGVVVGGSALTIPFQRFHATVRETIDIEEAKYVLAEQSLKYLQSLYGYISSISPDLFHARPDLDRMQQEGGRYWIESSIPGGYGLGSSGAVSAAIYDLFFPGSRSISLGEQKADLATIESFFHGKSSGVDALTCHAGSALLFSQTGSVRKVELDPSRLQDGYLFFLLDSGEQFETGPLVKLFIQKMEKPGFASAIRSEYLDINQKLIEALLGERNADPALLVRALSDFQFKHFREMIPDKVIDLWIEGQITNEYYLKLNGSGGGYMLGITHDSSKELLESRWKEKIIWIE